MSLPTTKISQEPNIGRNLDDTDLLYISEIDALSPTGYKTAQITGKQIKDASGGGASGGKTFGQTQWTTDLGAGLTIPNNTTYNVFDAFDNLTDKFANGTTSYDEYNLLSGQNYLQLTFTGNSGSGDVVINGTSVNTSFDISESNTALAFSKLLMPVGFTAVYIKDNIVYLFYTGLTPIVTYTQNVANLSVSIGSPVMLPTTLKIPYSGTPYAGQRLTHMIRVSLNIDTGTIQTYSLSFRRSADDSIIGGIKRIQRNPDVSGDQYIFETYTKDEFDPFVTAGFYLRIDNNSGQSLDIINGLDFLIITSYQENTIFP